MNEAAVIAEQTTTTSDPQASALQQTRPRVARRRYIVDPRRQYRTVVLTVGLTVLLMVVINIAFGVLRSSQSAVLAATAPELRPMLEQQDARLAIVLVVMSLVFVVGIFVITVAETHRTAGAVYAVKQRLIRLRDGDLRVTLDFRPRDNLLDLKEPFNEMAASIRERVLADADELERMAREADSGADVAARLREFARQKRDQLS